MPRKALRAVPFHPIPSVLQTLLKSSGLDGLFNKIHKDEEQRFPLELLWLDSSIDLEAAVLWSSSQEQQSSITQQFANYHRLFSPDPQERQFQGVSIFAKTLLFLASRTHKVVSVGSLLPILAGLLAMRNANMVLGCARKLVNG